MLFIEFLKTVLIGIVEGITEWLPVSSTGHMILVEQFWPFEKMSERFYDMYLYVIQLGAILAVVAYYFKRLNPFSLSKTSVEKKNTWRLWSKVLVGVIPAGVLGLLLDDWLEEHVFSDGVVCYVVAVALIVYGILFILVEKWREGKEVRVVSTEELSYADSLKIGCFQVLSIIPGTSRSGSTILGGMSLGVSRTVAAEFSFFMAIPIMAGVSLIKIAKFAVNFVQGEPGYACTSEEVWLLVAGFIVAFVVSLFVVKLLMDFVKRHSFRAFGWYRIVFGAAVLLFFLMRDFVV